MSVETKEPSALTTEELNMVGCAVSMGFWMTHPELFRKASDRLAWLEKEHAECKILFDQVVARREHEQEGTMLLAMKLGECADLLKEAMGELSNDALLYEIRKFFGMDQS